MLQVSIKEENTNKVTVESTFGGFGFRVQGLGFKELSICVWRFFKSGGLRDRDYFEERPYITGLSS